MNFNDTVFVKLKPWARQRIEQQRVAAGVPARYASVAERPDGTSQWQLWVLMQEVGPLIAMGDNDPFAMEFEVAPSGATQVEGPRAEPAHPNYAAYLVAFTLARRGLDMPPGWHAGDVGTIAAAALAVEDAARGAWPTAAASVTLRIRGLLT